MKQPCRGKKKKKELGKSTVLWSIVITEGKGIYYLAATMWETVCVCVCVCVSPLVMSDYLRPHGLYLAHQAPLSMVFFRQEYYNG